MKPKHPVAQPPKPPAAKATPEASGKPIERKGAKPAGKADSSARTARDQAQLTRATDDSPRPLRASSPEELVGGFTVTPNPPAFGQTATLSFRLTERSVECRLGPRSVLVGVSGSLRLSAGLSLTWPDPPKPHAWQCKRCRKSFTLGVESAVCESGRAPVTHDWECQVSWKPPGINQSTKHCHAGLTLNPCSHGFMGLHDYRCRRGECGQRKLSDVVNPSSSNWLDVAGAAICIPGTAPRLHEWQCTRCDTFLSGSIRDVLCPDAPGSPPEVHGAFTANVELTLAIEALAQRLFFTLDPGELSLFVPNLPTLVAAGYHDALAGALDRLKRAFPVESPFRASYDAIWLNALQPLETAFAAQVRAVFVGLRDAVIAFARARLAQLDELFLRVVEFLSLVGDPRAVLELATQTLATALHTAQQSVIPKLWKLVDQLMQLVLRTLPALAQSTAAQILVATKSSFESHRGQIEVFLEELVARVAQSGQDAMTFSRSLLTTLRTSVGRFEEAVPLWIGATVALVPGTVAAAHSDYSIVLGSLFGVFVRAAHDDRFDLGLVFGPLIDRAKTVQKLTCDEAKLFLSHLGDDTLLKESLRWIHANWERFKQLIKEGADQLKQWIDYILELVQQSAHHIFPEHDRLVGILKWLQGVPASLLAPDSFGDVGAYLQSLGSTLRGGFHAWLTESAKQANTTKAKFLKDWVTQTNPLVQNLRRVQSAVAPMLGQAPGQIQTLSAEAVDRALLAIHDVQSFERSLWNIVYGGGLGEGPITAQISINGLFSERLEATGATLEISEPKAFSDALQSGQQIVGALGSTLAPDASFLSLDLSRTRLRVPHPTQTKPMRLEPTGNLLPPIPLYVPVPWNAGVAVAHLPEFYVIDMRYHFPYGDLGCYHVADLDNDGFVRSWEVRKVREAVTRAQTAEDFYDFALDCDGDGKITEHDLELAIEQQQNYVNGMMYRRATSPLGWFVMPSPTVWAFLTATDLTAESIPGGIERRGVMTVIDGQLAIPLPPIFLDGQNYYPIRFHYEDRMFVDKFDSLAPSLGGVSPPVAPLTASERWDVVVRGGKTGRDWQAYFTAEPFNPVLLTWNLMGTLYLRGVAGAGVGIGAGASVAAGAGVKGASYIHFAYESTAPLIEVLEEWADRFKGIAETSPGDLPVPWAFIKGILEWTDVPRLSRALIQLAGPLIDVLFDWCDEQRHIRGALGYVRQYVLNHCRPAPTWEELRFEVNAWSDVSSVERAALLGAVRDTQREIGNVADEDPVYVPWLLARNCRKALAALQPPVTSGPAEARIKKELEDARGRFAAGLDQLVPAGDGKEPYAANASIPLCGSFKVVNQFLAAFAVRWQDLKDNAHPSEATLDQILAVRGNPFWKPIYHAVVEFGPEAKLFTCPNQNTNYFIDSVAGQKGIVEGSRLLEDAAGNRWLWVRTDSWSHGWVYIDKAVAKQLFSMENAAKVAGAQMGKDIAADLIQEVLGTAGGDLLVSVMGEEQVDKLNRGVGELIDLLAGKGLRPTITRIEASPPSTTDESRYARVCRAMLARRRAGRRLASDADIYRCYCTTLGELDMRMHGAHAPDLTKLDVPPGLDVMEALGERLADSFNQLSLPKREKLWAAGTAWLKILLYAKPIIEHLVDALVPPALEGDFEKAWNNFLEVLRKTKDVQLEELLLMSQMCAPAVKEVILTMIDIGIKLKSIKDAVTNKEANIAGSGEVGAAGDPGQVTWKDMGVKILRLLIDDEEEPGRPSPPKKKEQRGLRKNHDHAIGFSFEASAKLVEEQPTDAATKKPTNERVIALAEPWVARIQYRDTRSAAAVGAAASSGGDSGDDEVEEGQVDDDQGTVLFSDLEEAEEEWPEGEVDDYVAAPGTSLELQVTEWGALVFSDPPTAALVASKRIPQAFKDSIGWQVCIVDADGNAGEWETLSERGESIRFEVTDAHRGQTLRFRTFWGKMDWAAIVAADQAAAEAKADVSAPGSPS